MLNSGIFTWTAAAAPAAELDRKQGQDYWRTCSTAVSKPCKKHKGTSGQAKCLFLLFKFYFIRSLPNFVFLYSAFYDIIYLSYYFYVLVF